MGAIRTTEVSRAGAHGYVVSKCDEYGELCEAKFFLMKKEAEDYAKEDLEKELSRHKKDVKGSRLYQDGDVRPIIYLNDPYGELQPIQWLISRVAIPKETAKPQVKTKAA